MTDEAITSDARPRVYYDHEPAYRDRLARGWSGWSDAGCLDADAAFRSFLQSAHFPVTGRALDLGCGGGEICVRLAMSGWVAVGVEFSSTALTMARSNAMRVGMPVRYVRADLTARLPLAPESFDLVIDNHVLHCLVNREHRQSFLASAFHALHPNGVFFSATMSCEGRLDYDALDIDVASRVSRTKTRKWASRTELEGEFESAGLEIASVSSIEATGPPYPGDELVFVARRR